MLKSRTKQFLQKEPTTMRKPITPEEKLAITLCFVPAGESYKSLMYQYRVSDSTISKSVPVVCDVISKVFTDESMPSTENDWLKIATEFEELWKFPNCIGALDGKHIALFHSLSGGSNFYNYQGFESIYLVVLVDANYKFLYVDTGCQGHLSDGAVYRNCFFYKSLTTDQLKIHDLTDMNDSFLNQNGRRVKMPYVIVADNAFPLSRNSMKLYPQKNLSISKSLFHYRLSRARRTVENGFGIFVSRFKIFDTKISLQPANATKIVLCCCVLHNMLRTLSNNSYSAIYYGDVAGDNGRSEILTKVVGEASPSRHMSSLYSQHKRGIVAMMQKRLGVTLKITSKLVV